MAVIALCSKFSCMKEQAIQKVIYVYIYIAMSRQTCHEKVCFEECISGTRIVKEIMSESFLRLLLLD